MNLPIETISKINSLPNELLFEVNDYIDFLYTRHNLKSQNAESGLVENDMSYYLSNLNEYETLLAENKIKW